MEITRNSAHEAIDNFILGENASEWRHEYISDSAVPYCDIAGKRICSPAMPSSINPMQDTLIRGKNEHEAGHALLTPSDKNPSWSAIKGNLVNVLEDLRIERGVKTLSPVFETDLDTCNSYLIDKHQTRFLTGEYDGMKPVNETLLALHFQANGMPAKWNLSPVAKAYYDASVDTFNEWKNADYTTKNGFATIVDIADRVIAKWNEARQEMAQQQGQDGENSDQQTTSQQDGQSKQGESKSVKSVKQDKQDGKQDKQDGDGHDEIQQDKQDSQQGDADLNKSDQQDGNESSDQQDGKQDGQDGSKDGENGQNADNGENTDNATDNAENGEQDGQDGNESSDQQDSASSTHKTHQNPNGASSESKSVENDFVDNDYEADAIREELEKAFEESKSVFGDYIPYTEEDEVIRAPKSERDFNDAFANIRGATSKLSSHLEQSLKSMSRTRTIHDRDRGQLQVRRNACAIAKSLSTNIFSTTTKGISLDTSVSILIDESGSIGYNTSREFQKIVIAFSEVMERLKIKFEVIGHTSVYSRHLSSENAKHFTRTTKMVIYEHKNFNERYQAEKYRLGSIDYHSCNLDGEALLTAYRRNMEQKSTRHVILVFSDGLPNDGKCLHSKLYRNLTDTISLCRKNGVEVYAFGIQTREPEKFYGAENFVYLKSINDMTDAFFRRTSQIIAQGAR